MPQSQTAALPRPQTVYMKCQTIFSCLSATVSYSIMDILQKYLSDFSQQWHLFSQQWMLTKRHPGRWVVIFKRLLLFKQQTSFCNYDIWHSMASTYGAQVNTLEVIVLTQSWWNLLKMFASIKSRSSSKLGHLGSKTRSLGQISRKPC